MSRNPTFEKALALLAHPACLAALGLLMVNDHLFRHWWPSWWTGKVGDLAWLLFAPFALAAVLAWLLPLREPIRERWTFPLAFGLVGLVFGLFKLVPVLADMATRSSTIIMGFPLITRPDPTDLMALPALALGIILWRTAKTRPFREQAGLVALPLAALLTLANAAMPDPGIVCLARQDGLILASAGYTTFSSQDGGLTWQTSELGMGDSCERQVPPTGQWQEVDGPQPGERYRYQPGVAIQISTGSSQDWQSAYDLSAVSEAEQIYFVRSRPGNAIYEPGPLDALPDPASGNMLFAMGHQGVLVHTAGDQWNWSAVDGYHAVEPFPTADAFWLLLGGMLYPAAGLAFLIYVTTALRWTFNTLRLVVAVLAWIAWLLVVTLFPPATSYGYTQTITILGLFGLFILLLPLAIEQTVRLTRLAPRVIVPLAGFGLLGGLLYLLPYVLWLYSTLPDFTWATTFAMLIAVAVLAAAFAFTRRNSSNQG